MSMSKDNKTLPNNQTYLPNITTNTTPTVDLIGKIRLTGNIVPSLWFEHITYSTPKGKVKTNYLALLILSDLVYWYTPKIQKHEHTGQIIAISKRFKNNKLQRSYKQYAKMLNTEERTVKASVDLLVKLGILTREFRNITLDTGLTLANVMYLEPIPNAILHITHNTAPYVPPPTKNCTTPPTKNCTTYTETIKYRESIIYNTKGNSNELPKCNNISEIDDID